MTDRPREYLPGIDVAGPTDPSPGGHGEGAEETITGEPQHDPKSDPDDVRGERHDRQA